MLSLIATLIALSTPSLGQDTGVPDAADSGTDELERREALVAIRVHKEPDKHARPRGRLTAGEPFFVVDRVEGDDCPVEGWAQLEGGGYVCLEQTIETENEPEALPHLVPFVHPDPREWDHYIETMTYDRNPPDKVEAMVPFVYAKRWKKWKAPQYANAEAFGRGDKPLTHLGGLRKYHFIDAVETPRGTTLIRWNGRAVPVDQVHIYPISKFHGRELDVDPVPEGTLPAWSVRYEGARVRTAPSRDAEVGATIDHQAQLVVRDTPVDKDGTWWEVPDGLGEGVPGYVHHWEDIRHWTPTAPPDGVGAEEIWLDVDRRQQVLAMRKGETTLFATLVSTGVSGWNTPRGLFRMRDKSIYGDMSSLPDAEKPYYVEKVPWVMHFLPRYALHGVFWHWGFGHRASHGCINMSVRDAKWVFDRIAPNLPKGWRSVYEAKEDPGTLLRVRHGDAPVKDRRYSIR